MPICGLQKSALPTIILEEKIHILDFGWTVPSNWKPISELLSSCYNWQINLQCCIYRWTYTRYKGSCWRTSSTQCGLRVSNEVLRGPHHLWWQKWLSVVRNSAHNHSSQPHTLHTPIIQLSDGHDEDGSSLRCLMVWGSITESFALASCSKIWLEHAPEDQLWFRISYASAKLWC